MKIIEPQKIILSILAQATTYAVIDNAQNCMKDISYARNGDGNIGEYSVSPGELSK